MPSYYRGKRKRFQSRYEILLSLRDKKIYWRKIEDLFNQTIGRLLPGPKLKPHTAGYSESVVFLPTIKFSQKNFRQLLFTLKKDGLIFDATVEEKKSLSITEKGLNWLKEFTMKPHLIVPEYVSEVEKGERVTIISYDIPEKMSVYRNWLRIVLRGMGFNKIQQSVWVGKIKMPADFVDDIIRYGLEKYVEIFEITKSGTLRSKF